MRSIRSWLLTPLLMLAMACTLTACQDSTAPSASGDAPPPATSPSFTIVATVGMVGDIAAQVAGDHATVRTLMSAGVDPHLYAPSRNDIQRIMEADMVLYNGLLLEGKLTDALQRAAASGKRVHAVTDAIDTELLSKPDSGEEHADPHLWMDPQAWAYTIDFIRDRLTESDPGHKTQYEANAALLHTQFQALDAYAMQVLHTVPQEQRVLVTAHDAFGYFGRRYGYEVLGIQGLSTLSEAGVRDIERLVNLLVDRQIKAIFVESTVSDRNVQALIAGAQARGHTVSIGGTLFSDAMGPEGTYEGTYLGMMDHNITTIARALGGEAPARGMQGKLQE
jgi:manganese/zinc/iron transport system substrate-binding protein